MVDVGRIKVAAAIVKCHYLFERGEMPVMKVRPAQTDVAQAGRAKLSDVVRAPGYLEAASVLCLRAHSDVVKLVVAEKTGGVTDVAPRLIEDALPADFGRRERSDLRRALIERRAI